MKNVDPTLNMQKTSEDMGGWLSEYALMLTELKRENLPELRTLLADNIEFRDPFNHTFNQDDFIYILQDMYVRLSDVKFDVHGVIQSGSEGVLHWTFYATNRLTGKIRFEGMSRVVADGRGLIVLHYDFWDGSLIMQKAPLVGRLINALRKQISHK